MEKEIEYKTGLSIDDYDRLKTTEFFNKENSATHDIYFFDTEDFKLSKNKTIVRLFVNYDSDTSTIQQKKYTGLNKSEEYSYDFKNVNEGLNFVDDPDKGILKKIGIKEDIKCFIKTVKNRYELNNVNSDPNIVEIVADKMEYYPLSGRNKGKMFMDCDLEMEVKTPNYKIFQNFLRSIGVNPKFAKKKQQRALDYYNM